jgi:hypothetical protein
MTLLRRWSVLLIALLCPSPGCTHRAGEVPPEAVMKPASAEGRLLRTGAIQLGPGLGKNAWRWQGDGQWGF